MRVQVQLHEYSSRSARHPSTQAPASRFPCASKPLLHCGARPHEHEPASIDFVSDTTSRSSCPLSIPCSQHSESENATASDLPGAGRTVGKLFDRLCHSLETLVNKRRAKRAVSRGISEADNEPVEEHGIHEDGAAETASQDSCSSSDAEGAVLCSEHACTSIGTNDVGSSIFCPSDLSDSSRLSFSTFATTSDSFALTTCSLARSPSTNATFSDLPGPGRLLGHAYSMLGGALEDAVNTLFAGRGPDAIAERLHPVLRRLLHSNFLLQYKDLERAEIKGMEDILGVQLRGKGGYQLKKKSRECRKGEKGNNLQAPVKMQIEQSCTALLEHASNPALHEMQVRALSNVLELAATYPVARQCLIALGARDRVAALSLEAVVHVKIAAVDEYGQWPVEHSRKLGDAVKTLSLLRARCVIVLGENDVYDLWHAFFLAGDECEREKTVLRLLTFFSNKDLAFLAARALTSILRRPIGPGRRDLPETTWSQLFLTLSRLLLHERDRTNISHHAGPYRTRIDPGALDVLIRAALERASIYFGQFSLSFTDEESPLMTVVYALHGQESSHLHYPDATEFASMLVSTKSRQRMRHASA